MDSWDQIEYIRKMSKDLQQCSWTRGCIKFSQRNGDQVPRKQVKCSKDVLPSYRNWQFSAEKDFQDASKTVEQVAGFLQGRFQFVFEAQLSFDTFLTTFGQMWQMLVKIFCVASLMQFGQIQFYRVTVSLKVSFQTNAAEFKMDVLVQLPGFFKYDSSSLR